MIKFFSNTLILACASFFLLLRSIIAAYGLSELEFSTYSTAILISGLFNMVSCLGFYYLMQREMAFKIIIGKKLSTLIITIQVYAVNIIVGFLSITIMSMCESQLFSLPIYIVISSIFHGVSQKAFLISATESRVSGDLFKYTRYTLLRASAMLLVDSILIYYKSSSVVIIQSETLISIGISLFLLSTDIYSASRNLGFLLPFVIKRANRVNINSSLYLLFLSVVNFLFSSADRWFAMIILSPEHFANYSFASIIITCGTTLQGIINAQVYPIMARIFSTKGSRISFNYAIKISVFAFILGVAVMPFYSYFIDSFVNNFFPKYINSVYLFKIFGLISVIRLSDFITNFVTISGMEKNLFYMNLVCLIIMTGSVLILAGSNWNLSLMYSLGIISLTFTILSFFISFYVSLSFVRRKL